MARIPGPRTRIPIRSLASVAAKLRFARDPLMTMTSLFERHGDIVQLIDAGGQHIFSSNPECRGTVFVRGAELLRAVELDPRTYHRSAVTGRLYPHGRSDERHRALKEYGTGLFAVNDDEHARHRRLLSEGFGRRSVEAWVPEFVEIARRATEAWEFDEVIDVREAMMVLTLRVATRAFFGEEIGRDHILARAQEASFRSLISPAVVGAPWDLPGLPYRRFLDQVVTTNRELRRLVAERTAEGAQGFDLISAMVRASDADTQGMTESQVVGHVGVLFAAGHETTANALTWTIFLLSQHPKVAAAVADEVQAVLRGGEPTLEILNAASMPLLERVINESLRIMPPAPWTARETCQRAELGGYELAPATEVIPSIFHTHRIPELWPHPARFDPARWETADPTPYEFNPFGGGPRMCIGRAFAMMEMRLLLAFLLSRFRFEPIPGTQVDPTISITVSIRDGLPMLLRKSDGGWEQAWSPAEGDIHRYLDLAR